MKLRPIAKTAKHKKFEYQPRYYDPEKEKRKKRLNNRDINFERKTSRGQARSIVLYALGLAAIFWYLLG
jgi:predicted RNA-binding protein with PUA-like domain